MGIIKGICISKERGTEKHEVEEAGFVKDWGIQGDAHAGKWHRQVSLLSFEKIEEFRAKGADVAFGAFGENLIVEGYDFKNLPVGTRFRCGKVLLEMTQIGKECHSHCQIYQRMGECIMPHEVRSFCPSSVAWYSRLPPPIVPVTLPSSPTTI